MGMLWKFQLQFKNKKPIPHPINSYIQQTLDQWEKSFSPFIENSDVAIMLKSKDLVVKPSERIYSALKTAKELYVLTNKSFNVCYLNKEDSSCLDSINIKPDGYIEFQATKPKKLDFNGMLKGMLLGYFSEHFIKQGARSVIINAGNGNQVRVNAQQATFSSLSAHKVKGSAHIFNKNGQELKTPTDRASIICRTSTSNENLMHWGALSDAFSTSRIIDPKFESPTPKCQKI